MRYSENLEIGKRFGKLRIISNAEPGPHYKKRYNCICDCGNTHETYAQNLKNGKSTSCGCETSKKRSDVSKIHGMSNTPEYRTWCHMKQRCLNPNNARYLSYGGRGITVCSRWMLFENFYSDMGKRPVGTTIERNNNDKGYSPDNCKWATAKEQQNNTRFNRNIKYQGETKTLTQWCEELNLNYGMVQTRIIRGWDTMKAFETKCDANQVELTLGNETKTIKQWVKITGISRVVLYTRWQRNWPDERILTTPLAKKQTEYLELEYNGSTKSLSEWCKELGLDRKTTRKRLKRGWSVGDCFEIPLLNNSLKLKNIRKNETILDK